MHHQYVRVQIKQAWHMMIFQNIGHGEWLERAAELKSVVLEEKPSTAGQRKLVRKEDCRGNIQLRHILWRAVYQADERIGSGVMACEAFDDRNDPGAAIARADGQERGLGNIFGGHRS
jgi:hypothetical protein